MFPTIIAGYTVIETMQIDKIKPTLLFFYQTYVIVFLQGRNTTHSITIMIYVIMKFSEISLPHFSS